MEGYWRAKFQNKITNNLSVQNVIQIACKRNSDGCFFNKEWFTFIFDNIVIWLIFMDGMMIN